MYAHHVESWVARTILSYVTIRCNAGIYNIYTDFDLQMSYTQILNKTHLKVLRHAQTLFALNKREKSVKTALEIVNTNCCFYI